MNYFTEDELKCKCGCGQNGVKSSALKKLNNARSISGVPYHLNSAYRCPKHNKEVGGSDTSSHPLGEAFDIETTNSRNRYKILEGLIEAGFTRIGIAKTFIHADDDELKDQEVAWLY